MSREDVAAITAKLRRYIIPPSKIDRPEEWSDDQRAALLSAIELMAAVQENQ